MIRKGTYILTMTLTSEIQMEVGRLGSITFPAGEYCYVGSAMNGLDQRIGRHLSKEKKMRWHIDRLTMAADRTEAFESSSDPVPECTLAHMAEEAGGTPFADGFGCSDCGCRTHLFLLDKEVRERLTAVAGLVPHVLR
ncbi:MAG: GIY-YIG nuclease family protein [Candidatus Methanoplasma sp.]|jgi:Uri superfamily endonuclease|nr:GIY-YIG nuclease family protein [Candidatus Methanoplasma sp.]